MFEAWNDFRRSGKSKGLTVPSRNFLSLNSGVVTRNARFQLQIFKNFLQILKHEPENFFEIFQEIFQSKINFMKFYNTRCDTI